MSALLGILGVALDARFGEPQGWHPLVAFGRLADRLERRFNRSRLAGEGDPGVGWRSRGDRLGPRGTAADPAGLGAR